MNLPIVIDIENLGNDPRKGGRLLCIGYGGEGTAFDVAESLPDWLAEALADPDTPVISQSKHDPVWLRREGYDVAGPFYDTMTMAHLLNENTKFDLDSLVELYCHYSMDKRLRKSEKKIWFTTDEGKQYELDEAWDRVPEQVMHYCKRDAVSTLDLFCELKRRMLKNGWWYEYLTEHVPMTGILVSMECAGIPINLAEAETLKDKLSKQAAIERDLFFGGMGYEFNIDSTPQLRTVLYSDVWEQQLRLPITKDERDYLRKGEGVEPELPNRFEITKVGTSYVYGTVMQKGLGLEPSPVKTDKGEYSTSKGTLTVYYGGNEHVKQLLKYRELEKIIGTYLSTYPEFSYDGRLYGRFNQTGTVTGRLSHSNPNLGNQPTRGDNGHAIRGLFQGRFIIGDHSQLENRFMAHFSQDPVLLDIYRRGLDIHSVTAERIFGKPAPKGSVERDVGKTAGYAMGYGAGWQKLAQIMAINGHWMPEDKVKEFLNLLEDSYEVFFRWKRHVQREAKRVGYVKTIGGRYRRLRYAYGSQVWKVRSKADRQAVNSIIQGSAADILRRNMIHTQSQPVMLLNQIHDELIWEWPDDPVWREAHGSTITKELQHICENPGFDMTIPLEFEPKFVSSWAEKETGGALMLPDESEDIEVELSGSY